MGAVNIPNTFASGDVIASAKVNDNFTAITAQVNGNLTDANIDSISEGSVVFSGTGHSHGGGASGKKIPEANVTFASTGGHTHNGTDATAIALAIANGASGSLLFKTGTVNYGGDHGLKADITFSGTAFTAMPIIILQNLTGANLTRRITPAAGNDFGGIKADVGFIAADFSKFNVYVYDDEDIGDIRWIAIGI
jgi:hypothetical protein